MSSSSYEIKKKKQQSKLVLNYINKFNEIPKFSENDQKKDKNIDIFTLNKASNITPKISKNILNSSDKTVSEEKIKKKEDIYTPEDINININMNINEEISQNDKIKYFNHEICSSCINNCINWTLKAHINKNKINNNQKEFKTNYEFKGTNLFFHKLDFSILNAFNNSLCFDRCFPNNKSHFDNKKNILEKLKQESFRQIKEINLKNDYSKDNIPCQ